MCFFFDLVGAMRTESSRPTPRISGTTFRCSSSRAASWGWILCASACWVFPWDFALLFLSSRQGHSCATSVHASSVASVMRTKLLSVCTVPLNVLRHASHLSVITLGITGKSESENSKTATRHFWLAIFEGTKRSASIVGKHFFGVFLCSQF